MRRGPRWFYVAIVAFGVLAPTTASAQGLPAPPVDVPQLPEPIPSTLKQVLDQVVPPANDAVVQGSAAAVATGFAFRPACSTVGTSLVALVLAGAYVPVPVNLVGQAVAPLLIFCAYTYSVGPADSVFLGVDGLIGPALTEQLTPVTEQLSDGMAPVREAAADGCGYSPLVAAPLTSIPPPLNRIDLLKIVCG